MTRQALAMLVGIGLGACLAMPLAWAEGDKTEDGDTNSDQVAQATQIGLGEVAVASILNADSAALILAEDDATDCDHDESGCDDDPDGDGTT